MASFFPPEYDTSTWLQTPTIFYSSATNTLPSYGVWPNWQAYYQPEPVDAIARDRRALAAVRTFHARVATVTPSRASRAVFSLAPRRTVVPRGHVSWVRAGTRRPL